MKKISLFFLAAFFSTCCVARADDQTLRYAGFDLSSHVAMKLDETFYNPFKVTSHQIALPVGDKTVLTNEEIAQMLADRKFQGFVFSPNGASGTKAIIGDAVFSVGDEIAFYNDNNVLTRLTPGCSVHLTKITRDFLEFEISIIGQPSRTMDYSLSSFYTP